MSQSEFVCGVEVVGRGRCARSLHSAPTYDRRPACIVHSNDPSKSQAGFFNEFERALREAEQNNTEADFAGWVFPECNFRGMIFKVGCSFFQARFTGRADFSHASFAMSVDFFEARFEQKAEFNHTRYGGIALFMRCEFLGEVSFGLSRFSSEAVFMSATLHEGADFSQAQFEGSARFGGARFKRNAVFRSAKFCGNAEFSGTKFARLASFRESSFNGSLEFHETRFRHDLTDRPGLDFSSVDLDHPGQVKFYRVDLGQALFYHTDVSNVSFALAEWRDRGRIRSRSLRKRLFRVRMSLKFWTKPSLRDIRSELAQIKLARSSSRVCVFEEDVYPFGDRSLDLWRGPDGRNLGLIAEIYQQLKRNYDAKGDYWTAGHWHYGEMEMKRLHSRSRSRWLRWLTKELSLVALYKHASEYGESYLRPLAWLVFFIVAFALLYPIIGLELSRPAGGIVSYWNYLDYFRAHPLEHPAGLGGVILHGLMTSLSVAGFQRELRYTPSYPWGRLLALLELLLTTTLGGLFLLAIRRQFKRS